MTALAANIDATQTLLPVDAGLTNGSFQLPLYYTVDSESIRVTGRAHRTTWLVERGIAGTTAATHLSAATLTRYYPEAASSAGGGAIAVTDGTTTVEDVTTLNLLGSVVTDEGAGEASVAQAVLSRTTIVTDAQIKALPTTQVELVPAPGASTVLVFLRAIYILDSALGAYGNFDAAPLPQLEITEGTLGGTQIDASNYLQMRGRFNNAHLAVALGTPAVFFDTDTVYEQIIGNDLASITNKPLLLRAYNGASGDFNGGNAANSLKVIVWYGVVTV